MPRHKQYPKYTVDYTDEDYQPLETREERRDLALLRLAKNVALTIMTPEQQARRIAKSKRWRWKTRHVPSYIANEIDLSDTQEVRKWESIDYNSRFPFLKQILESKEMHGCTITGLETLVKGMLVYDIENLGDDPEAPTLIGKIWFEDGTVYDVCHVEDKTWTYLDPECLDALLGHPDGSE